VKLLGTLTSPYVRKVRIVLLEKRIDCAFVEESPAAEGNRVAEYNPLGKIPVLVLEDGSTLFDSRVIVEYLDTVSPVSRLLPDTGRQRIAVKRWEALADGVCDAAATIVNETRRDPAERSQAWIDRQQGKIERGVHAMADELGERPWCNGEGFTLADIALGCALGYVELRQPKLVWRRIHPHLARHFDRLSKRPSFVETAPPAA
jgi:glutathione S-transferase